MGLTNLDRLFALFLMGFGIYILSVGIQYGYFRDGIPGPGFFPFWTGLAMAILSAINLINSIVGKESYADSLDREQVIPIVGVCAVLAAYLLIVPYLGMLLPVPLFVLGVAFTIQRRWDRGLTLKILASAALLPIGCYLVFGRFLDVTLIRGPFGF